MSSELLLQCDDLPNGQVLDDLTYDVGMDGKWQGTPRRWVGLCRSLLLIAYVTFRAMLCVVHQYRTWSLEGTGYTS